jgi:type IV pilus assembly protein PilC
MKFSVVVRTGEGAHESRSIDAANRFAIYALVEKEGSTVESIREGGGFSMPAWTKIQIGTGIGTEERITVTKNLSAMLTAGLTLSRALSVIDRQSSNKSLKKVMQELAASVKRGASFHEALAAHPKVFPPLYVAMAKAGEESGTLAASLKAIAKQMDRTHALAKKIRGAMIYPCIILFAIVVIGILMLLFVVPTLASTFEELNVPLPLSTRVILASSAFMTAHWVLAVLLMLLAVAAVAALARSKAGGAAFLWLSLRMPVVKTLVRETYSARATRSLASLISAGVDMLAAIGIAREVVGNRTFGAVLDEAQTRVRKGEPLSAAFNDHADLYPVFVGDMIAVGEETGNVAGMLGQVADYYETDVEEATKDLSTIIEPLLMLFIGVFVGIFAVSMIAPIYSISSAIN